MGPGGHPALRAPGARLVRQALAYGIDRVAIARAVGELTLASAAAREPLDSVVFLREQPLTTSRTGSDIATDRLRRGACSSRRAVAGELDGIYVCAGDRLSLRFAAPRASNAGSSTVKLAQAQLREVGVEVVPIFAPPSVLFGQILPSGEFDLMLFGWILGAITEGPADVFGCQASSNYTDYCDRLVTRDLFRAARILDDSRRVALLNRIDARLAKAVPVIPLFQNTGLSSPSGRPSEGSFGTAWALGPGTRRTGGSTADGFVSLGRSHVGRESSGSLRRPSLRSRNRMRGQWRRSRGHVRRRRCRAG